jgi:hypothetical protein
MKTLVVAFHIHFAQESFGGFDFASIETSIGDKRMGL